MILRIDSWLLSKTQAVSDWVMDHFHVTNYRIGMVAYVFFIAGTYLLPLRGDMSVTSILVNALLFGVFIWGWGIIPLYKTVKYKEGCFFDGDQTKNELEISRIVYRIASHLVIALSVLIPLMKTTVTTLDYLQMAFVPLIGVAEYFIAVTPRPPQKRVFKEVADFT